MWTAKRKGFPPDFKGFKSLIVLTDGEDNRFGKDERLQRSTGAPSIAEFIAKEFGASGIMINMIGFQVEPAEEQRFKEQFEQPIKKLPLAGRFDLVTKTDKLRATLRQLMKPQLRF